MHPMSDELGEGAAYITYLVVQKVLQAVIEIACLRNVHQSSCLSSG